MDYNPWSIFETPWKKPDPGPPKPRVDLFAIPTYIDELLEQDKVRKRACSRGPAAGSAHSFARTTGTLSIREGEAAEVDHCLSRSIWDDDPPSTSTAAGTRRVRARRAKYASTNSWLRDLQSQVVSKPRAEMALSPSSASRQSRPPTAVADEVSSTPPPKTPAIRSRPVLSVRSPAMLPPQAPRTSQGVAAQVVQAQLWQALSGETLSIDLTTE